MSIEAYTGKTVTITGNDGRIYQGDVCEYFYPSENESGNESIMLNCANGTAVEFEEADIARIVVLEEM